MNFPLLIHKLPVPFLQAYRHVLTAAEIRAPAGILTMDTMQMLIEQLLCESPKFLFILNEVILRPVKLTFKEIELRPVNVVLGQTLAELLQALRLLLPDGRFLEHTIDNACNLNVERLLCSVHIGRYLLIQLDPVEIVLVDL